MTGLLIVTPTVHLQNLLVHLELDLPQLGKKRGDKKVPTHGDVLGRSLLCGLRPKRKGRASPAIVD